MKLAVRPGVLAGQVPRFGGTSSGEIVGYPPQVLTFDLEWGDVRVEHRIPIVQHGDLIVRHHDSDTMAVGVPTGSVPWRLTEHGSTVGEGEVSTYVDERGDDFCVIRFDAVPGLESVAVYADNLAEIVPELELVRLVDLVGFDDLALPEWTV